MNMMSNQYRNSHCKDDMVTPQSYILTVIPIPGNAVFIVKQESKPFTYKNPFSIEQTWPKWMDDNLVVSDKREIKDEDEEL